MAWTENDINDLASNMTGLTLNGQHAAVNHMLNNPDALKSYHAGGFKLDPNLQALAAGPKVNTPTAQTETQPAAQLQSDLQTAATPSDLPDNSGSIGTPETPTMAPTGSVSGNTGYSVNGATINGSATTFGLNPDGSIDAQDNGKGAFGYNTRDPNLEGVSLPIQVIKNNIGDYEKDPAIFKAIQHGDYQVQVTGPNGVTRTQPIVDAGPAAWTGNALDLTHASTKIFGTNGKGPVSYQIIGPDGNPINING